MSKHKVDSLWAAAVEAPRTSVVCTGLSRKAFDAVLFRQRLIPWRCQFQSAASPTPPWRPWDFATARLLSA
jgi:hypothetical protein